MPRPSIAVTQMPTISPYGNATRTPGRCCTSALRRAEYLYDASWSALSGTSNQIIKRRGKCDLLLATRRSHNPSVWLQTEKTNKPNYLQRIRSLTFTLSHQTRRPIKRSAKYTKNGSLCTVGRAQSAKVKEAEVPPSPSYLENLPKFAYFTKCFELNQYIRKSREERLKELVF